MTRTISVNRPLPVGARHPPSPVRRAAVSLIIAISAGAALGCVSRDGRAAPITDQPGVAPAVPAAAPSTQPGGRTMEQIVNDLSTTSDSLLADLPRMKVPPEPAQRKE